MNKFVKTAGRWPRCWRARRLVAWEPTKPVEIVVAAGAGGASDQMARMMQAAIQKNKLMNQPMIVSLKGGASGAEALMYMKSSEGDPNKVLIAYSLIYMLPLAAKIPFNWRDLTPVSVIAMDEFVLWDNTTLPYKNVKEFVAAAKAADPPFKMGGTGSKREDQVLTVVHRKEDRRQVRVPAVQVGRRGGNATRRQSHGVQREQSVREPRGLARGPGARAVRVRQGAHRLQDQGHRHACRGTTFPTCKEEGLDVQYLMLRAMFLPGKVTPDQVGVLRRPVQEGDADARVQGLHGKAGAEAGIPHRQGHADVPRGRRHAEQGPDDRGRLRRAVAARKSAGTPRAGACSRAGAGARSAAHSMKVRCRNPK